MNAKKLCFLLLFFLTVTPVFSEIKGLLSGRIVTRQGEAIPFATAHLKGSPRGCQTDPKGLYHIKAPAGKYTLVITALGYKTVEREVEIVDGKRVKLDIVVEPEVKALREVAVTGTNG